MCSLSRAKSVLVNVASRPRSRPGLPEASAVYGCIGMTHIERQALMQA